MKEHEDILREAVCLNIVKTLKDGDERSGAVNEEDYHVVLLANLQQIQDQEAEILLRDLATKVSCGGRCILPVRLRVRVCICVFLFLRVFIFACFYFCVFLYLRACVFVSAVCVFVFFVLVYVFVLVCVCFRFYVFVL